MCEGIERSLSVISTHATVSYSAERHVGGDYMHESIVDTSTAERYSVNNVTVFRSEVIKSKRSFLRKYIIYSFIYFYV